jgi:hypothetical protein
MSILPKRENQGAPDRSWPAFMERVMLVLMIFYLVMNFVLPCGCHYMGRPDPRGNLMLFVLGFGLLHLISCTWAKRADLAKRSIAVGVTFLIVAVVTQPM